MQSHGRPQLVAKLPQSLRNATASKYFGLGNVRYGSLADTLTSPRHVRFVPNNGSWVAHPSQHLAVGFISTRPSSHRQQGQADRCIRFIEIPSSRTLSLPGESRDTENGIPMLEGYCMSRNGRSLPHNCIEALIDAGEVSRSEVERRRKSGK